MLRSTPARLAVALVPLLLLTACSSGGGTNTVDGVSKNANGTKLLTADFGEAGMDALLSGILSPNEDGCLGISSGTEQTTAIFPKGTVLNDDDSITLENGVVITLGQTIQAGGGFGAANIDFGDCAASSYAHLQTDIKIVP